ncbi:hypothetical protein [Thermaerobacillus caldiproteolyticus]|uniref:Uncharacterized protein n=1 Tax=Thermaerobacillus caldiproteolyticus TaxID=247480 RepID=A0A7V9Z8K1_9BACL|nr:hypothetical protein [Anoxybacillus caldiproteolyticus]MBA2876048.1 hypothetical protein [Anoxybacillus caldiproteolyticus]
MLNSAEKTPLSDTKLVHRLAKWSAVINWFDTDLVPPLVTHPYTKQGNINGNGTVGFKIQEWPTARK